MPLNPTDRHGINCYVHNILAEFGFAYIALSTDTIGLKAKEKPMW